MMADRSGRSSSSAGGSSTAEKTLYSLAKKIHMTDKES